ncbi:response regulator [Flavobacterium sp.]|uniref:response regulator n=1 Tax=Flavobacterium sp. TaxID=239 RepID=UPI003D0B24B0
MCDIKKTYIIDDDNIFTFVLKKLLDKHQGFGSVVDFKDGNEALNLLFAKNAELPCIILLDLNMPLLDGWQFLDELQASEVWEQLNVFILTSSIDYHDIEKSKQYSVVKDFISKPIDHSKLDVILEKSVIT